jgi:hypothetical protein
MPARTTEFDVETRLQLTFAMPSSGIDPLLPRGWVSTAARAGPARGSTMTLTFRVRLLTSIIGKDLGETPGERDIGALITAGMRNESTGEQATYVLHSFSANARCLPGPYGNSVLAEVARQQAILPDFEGNVRCKEDWRISMRGGAVLGVDLIHASNEILTAHSEMKVYGGSNPDFFRMYHVEKGIELILSRPEGIDRSSIFAIRNELPGIAGLMQADRCVCVAAEPWYRRFVSLDDA